MGTVAVGRDRLIILCSPAAGPSTFQHRGLDSAFQGELVAGGRDGCPFLSRPFARKEQDRNRTEFPGWAQSWGWGEGQGVLVPAQEAGVT